MAPRRALTDPPRYVGRIPGRVVRVAAGEGFVEVLTGDGLYRLYELSDEDGGTTMAATAAVRSVKDTLGLRGASLVERLKAVERELLDLRELGHREDTGQP